MSEWMQCDSCGANIFELSFAEQQQVAEKPYNYIFYCYQCQRDLFGER